MKRAIYTTKLREWAWVMVCTAWPILCILAMARNKVPFWGCCVMCILYILYTYCICTVVFIYNGEKISKSHRRVLTYLRDGHAGGSWFYVTGWFSATTGSYAYKLHPRGGHGSCVDPGYQRYGYGYAFGYAGVSYVRILIKSEVTFFAESQLQHHFAPYFRLVSDKCMLPAHSPPPNCP